MFNEVSGSVEFLLTHREVFIWDGILAAASSWSPVHLCDKSEVSEFRESRAKFHHEGQLQACFRSPIDLDVHSRYGSRSSASGNDRSASRCFQRGFPSFPSGSVAPEPLQMLST